MADRLLDCRRLDFRCEVPPRHRFVNRWSSLLWPLWFIVLVATGCAAWACFDRRLLFWGGLLLSVISVYYFAVHGCNATRRCLPKELIVGVLFALGTGLPIALHRNSAALAISVALLAALCVVNCLFVANTQRESDRQQHIGSAILLYPGLGQRLPFLAASVVVTTAVVGVLHFIPSSVALALAISGGGLMCLAWAVGRQPWISGSTHGSQLADYALLTPLLLWTLGG